MIVKASQRGGGQQLATHLLNSYDNERVEIMEIRGSLAPDLHGAFAEWRAVSKATNCKKDLYSLSVNPDPEQGRLTREQYQDFLNRAEKKLGLDGRPRAVVFHIKKDKEGIPREHCHAVWSRIDTEKLKAVHMGKDWLSLRSVVREFAKDHNLTLPRGVARDSLTGRFNARNKFENLQEKQQEERTGQSKEERQKTITEAWQKTTDGRSFVAALEERGFYLAQGTTRKGYVVVDRFGEIHGLARQIDGVRTKQLAARLTDFPLEKLPTPDKAKQYAEEQREKIFSLKQDFAKAADRQREALAEFHKKRRAALDGKLAALQEQHRIERETLIEAQTEQTKGILSDRLQAKPKGLKAFLVRITGIQFITERKQQREDTARGKQHQEQRDALHRRHSREIEDFQHHYRALAKIETREMRSCEMAIRRQEFKNITKDFEKVVHDRTTRIERLSPVFNAVAEPPAKEIRNGKKGVSAEFDRQADPNPQPKQSDEPRQIQHPPRKPGFDRER